MTKTLRLLFLTVLPFLLFALPAAASTATTAVARSDYTAYKSTRYAKETWNPYVEEGIAAFHAGSYDIAQTNLYKAFNLGCESPIVLFQLALIAEYQKSWYSALEFYKLAGAGFKKANKGHRYAVTFNENYGRALYYSGRKDEAIPLLKSAARNTKSYWLLKMLGLMAFAEGDTESAGAYLERAATLKGPEVTEQELVYLYTLLARIYLNKGERDLAVRCYTKVREFDPQNKEAKEFMDGIRKTYQQDQMMHLFDELKDI